MGDRLGTPGAVVTFWLATVSSGSEDLGTRQNALECTAMSQISFRALSFLSGEVEVPLFGNNL